MQWDQLILGLKHTTKEFIENILQNIIESIVVADLSGRLILFNKYSEEMFGYTSAEVLDRHIVILGVLRPNVIDYIRRNQSFNDEVVLRRKSGATFPARVRCVPLRNEQGDPIAMVGVATDLTHEKEKERIAREVAHLKAFNENIIESLNDGILTLNFDGRVTFVNRKMEALLGYAPGVLVDMRIADLLTPEGQPLFEAIIAGGEGAPEQPTLELNWFSRTGKKLHTIVRVSPLNENGARVGIIAAVSDKTEVRDLKEELFQAEKMSLVGTLASEVAHEINNPLGGLIVAVQMMIEDLRDGQFDHEGFLAELIEIEKDAKRCRHITRQLLDLSRPVPEERSLIDLNQVIEEALFFVQRQAELDNISFDKSYASDLPVIRVNPNSLQQVIINVVKNSRDAMPGQGAIRISTRLRYDGLTSWAVIHIADTGPGIPQQILDNIFNPFTTTKGKGRGTGLGLAVSKRIVEEFGGQIRFWNHLQGGAVCEIVLPAY